MNRILLFAVLIVTLIASACAPVQAPDPRVHRESLPADKSYPQTQAGYVATVQKSDGTAGVQTWYWELGDEGPFCVTVNKLTVQIKLQAPAGYDWEPEGDQYCMTWTGK